MPRVLSHAEFIRAQGLMPGGVNSPNRAFGNVGGEPIFFRCGAKSYLFDLDGNRYVDFTGSEGSLILGHAHPAVVDAVREAVGRGTSFGAPTVAESQLAELITAAVPSIERVRLVNSGTEATMSALRLARAFTGRDVIVKFLGNYHGHCDSVLVAAGSSTATLAVSDSPGVTVGTARDTLILPYNDATALEATFDRLGQRIAAVILEPVGGHMGVVLPTAEFLQAARQLTARHGAVLIFDEVMTGFRVSYGGAQQLFGIRPDLTTLGTIVGGGLPVGAYGGRADIMDRLLPAGPVFQAGTLSGNPLATAAGIVMLRLLRDEPPYAQLKEMSAHLATGLSKAATAACVPHSVARIGSMLTLFFNPLPVTDWQSADRSDRKRYARYFWAMIERGIYLPCSQFAVLFVSAAHTPADIVTTLAAARQALAHAT
jgi:glutamate-1-semialdehyde 2,1-aminomutase